VLVYASSVLAVAWAVGWWLLTEPRPYKAPLVAALVLFQACVSMATWLIDRARPND
jgi:hypothetical protein